MKPTQWLSHRLVYRVESPVHIGRHTLGYIKRTRNYIPGKSFWGALTANHVRRDDTPLTYNDYYQQGVEFQNQVCFSYFFPTIDATSPLMPTYTTQGMVYGDFRQAEFERLFIRSFGQTAVTPDSNTADDGTLHETDFISPHIGDETSGEFRHVCFIGYVFLKKSGVTWREIKPSLERIFAGSDRKNGWGALSLISDTPENDQASALFGYKTDLAGKSVCVTIPAGSPVCAHLAVDKSLNLMGDIEPLVGREWNDKEAKGAGRHISKATVCWMPGSVTMKEQAVTIDAFGVLKAHSHGRMDG